MSMAAEIHLVPEGVYDARLVETRAFTNTFGARLGLVFILEGGQFDGVELMESAAAKASPRGKLAELLRGMGHHSTDAKHLIGHPCQIAVKHETSKSGKKYAAITGTFPVKTQH
jgi:hypothetical protein